MRTTLLRFVAFTAMVVITFTGLETVAAPAQARAASADADFTFAVFPVDSPFTRVRDSWGAYRRGGRRHSGTDIIAPRGTKILAVADGVVIEMDYRSSSGYYVRIDHGNGWQTAYLHLNNDTYGTDDGEGGPWTAYYPTLTVGTQVFAGDVIGYVGDSGNAEDTIPHAHLAIAYEGDKRNPYPLVIDALEREQRTIQISLEPV